MFFTNSLLLDFYHTLTCDHLPHHKATKFVKQLELNSIKKSSTDRYLPNYLIRILLQVFKEFVISQKVLIMKIDASLFYNTAQLTSSKRTANTTLWPTVNQQCCTKTTDLGLKNKSTVKKLYLLPLK